MINKAATSALEVVISAVSLQTALAGGTRYNRRYNRRWCTVWQARVLDVTT